MLRSIGPAIIVAAVVLGPGSILTSSKVGASLGMWGLPVIVIAVVMMIAMVMLAMRVGVSYENSPCDELAVRLGRPAPVVIGLTLFTLVAFFQSSNNIALIAGLEPLLGDGTLSLNVRIGVLVAFNAAVIAVLYLARDLYKLIESLMKILIGAMTVSFLVNFAIVAVKSEGGWARSVQFPDLENLLPVMGLFGTTFSVGGAFYQAYLVRDRGWTTENMPQGKMDAMISISLLGVVTAVILMTSALVFFPNGAALADVGDVARQLEPTFGSVGRVIFCGGILAGAASSFMVNGMIGGTVLSDSFGAGARITDRWPSHLTALALLVGAGIACASFASEHGPEDGTKDSTVHLITFAQALTVLGIPVLALALIYLGTRPELTGDRKVPRPIITLALIGFLVACVMASLTAHKVLSKLEFI